ncbi:hypothetical protein CXX84_15525 [Arthrobacter sp. AFG7.2]|uniref:DUF624 domain-containing protein n=1 Tax=Arthrobacter sp. AFG7.2 TaxID=1688693 RepID=UPI000C9DF0EC|nr:DUF624 domain-containing protein [Arthrobacter sp. AFG7.2]PNI07727.1 hypothetical protein CXX84_15525 [Arthrobacter sp. AFG7.2]
MVQNKAAYGAGPLFRAAGTVAGVMMGHVLLVLGNLLLVFAPLLGNWLLVLLACVPLGPSLVAAMYAFNRLLAGHETGVFKDFRRGYRMNFRPALVVWLPHLLLLAVIAFNLVGLPLFSGPGNGAGPALRGALLVLGLLVATAALNGLLLLSRFTFPVRDIYRLSLYGFGAQKRVALGNAGILFVAAFLLLMTTTYLMLVVAGALVFLVCLNSRPLLRFIEARFTA